MTVKDSLPGYPAPQDINEDPEIMDISGTKKNIPDIVKAIVNKNPAVLSQLTVPIPIFKQLLSLHQS